MTRPTAQQRIPLAGVGVIGVIGALVASGCSSDDEHPDNQNPPPSFLAVYEPREPGSGDDSLMRGQLRLEDDCIYLDTETDNGTVILLFPDDEVMAAEEEERFIYQGEEYGDGDAIEAGGGGSGNLSRALDSTDENVSAPESCDGNTRVFWVRSE